MLSTYILSGFGSFGSMGSQLGVLSAIAPSRMKDYATLAMRAMIDGNVACFLSTCIAGIRYLLLSFYRANSDRAVYGPVSVFRRLSVRHKSVLYLSLIHI